MNKYDLNKNFKTRILNVFRLIFTIPLMENILVSLAVNKNNFFFQKIVPPNYLYKKNSIRKIERNGVNYKLDISNVVDHYLYFGFLDSSYNSVLEIIKKSQVILDIGANIGTTSLYFASLNSTTKILSFEPHPDTYKRAVENINLNRFENIEIINIGLGEKHEILKLYEVNENNPGMNRIILEDKNIPFKAVNINVLDDFLESRGINKVDFIKIDVEGFEYSVLMGAKNILKTKPAMLIELDDDNLRENNKTAKMLVDYLFSIGYNSIIRADNLEEITSSTLFNNCHYDIIVK